MTDNTPPEALRLANVCSNLTRYSMDAHLIAAELRRQHTRIAELEALSGVQALSAAPGEPPGIQALMCVISSLRDIAHFSEEEGGELMSALCALRDWANAQTVAAPQPAPAEQEEAAQRLRKTLDIDPGDVNDPLHPRYIAGFKSGSAAGRRRAAPAASPTPPAEQQAQPDECFPGEPKVAVPQGLISAACFAIRKKRDGGKVLEQLRRYSVGDRSQPLAPQQAAPEAAPGVGNSGFDHKTAADLLNNKTVSDEAVRKFVATSRWAHDERASLSAMLLSVRGELASREEEIALLKKALLEAEAPPQQEAQEPCGWTTGITWRPGTRLQSEQVIKITRDAQPNYGYTTPIYTAPQQGAQEPDHSLRTDALCQLAYCNGMKAGWNYCVDGNEVDFARAMEGVSEAMKVLRELRENAPQPAPPSEREAFERDWEKRHAPVPINGRTHDDGRYGDLSIQDAWESWQARAALAASVTYIHHFLLTVPGKL